jgi:hypothetical protein
MCQDSPQRSNRFSEKRFRSGHDKRECRGCGVLPHPQTCDRNRAFGQPETGRQSPGTPAKQALEGFSQRAQSCSGTSDQDGFSGCGILPQGVRQSAAPPIALPERLRALRQQRPCPSRQPPIDRRYDLRCSLRFRRLQLTPLAGPSTLRRTEHVGKNRIRQRPSPPAGEGWGDGVCCLGSPFPDPSRQGRRIERQIPPREGAESAPRQSAGESGSVC